MTILGKRAIAMPGTVRASADNKRPDDTYDQADVAFPGPAPRRTSAVPGPRRSGATAVPGVHGENAPSQALPYPGYWTSGIRLPERLNLQLS
jgi:hypothetical protein